MLVNGFCLKNNVKDFCNNILIIQRYSNYEKKYRDQNYTKLKVQNMDDIFTDMCGYLPLMG